MGKNKNREKRRKQERTNAAKARRVERNAQKPPDFSAAGKAISAFAERMKAAAEKRQHAGFDPKAPHPDVSGTLPKPDFQGVLDDLIHWTWEAVEDTASVHAKLITSDMFANDSVPKPKGTYIIQLSMVDNAERLTPAEAKRVAEALLSAAQWENVWEQFVGEYIANGGFQVQPATERGPEAGPAIYDEAKNLPDAREWLADKGFVPSQPQGDVNPLPVFEPHVADNIAPVVPIDPAVVPHGMNPEWCLGGGQLPKRIIRGDGTERCDLCGRELKLLKNGKFAPHKKVIKK